MRLFVALTPPSDVQQAVWDAFAPLRRRPYPVKWVHPDGIHLTLKFLGEVGEDRQAELVGALGEAVQGARAVTLVVQGAGAFPDPKRPRVFWAGVAPDPAIELLADRVERVFAPLGFPTEARAFRPHLTLGRAARHARTGDFAGVESALETLPVDGSAVVDGVDLMKSVLRPDGAVYERVHRERLS
ncbi:MAG TPA: RNA 2',3'-cyclic phosphodiesterase [Gemmatimonadales bacterium]|nr:RNA 2',3'-cyclic phosphodiesterase [Gemmatimonadales bacterium]